MPTSQRTGFADYNRATRRQRIIGVGRAIREADEPQFPEPKTSRVRILAEYDLFGDIATTDWEKSFLASAVDRHDEIEDINVVFVMTGAYGLRRVLFFVDAKMIVADEERLKDDAYNLLCNIVRENDVRVNFVAPL